MVIAYHRMHNLGNLMSYRDPEKNNGPPISSHIMGLEIERAVGREGEISRGREGGNLGFTRRLSLSLLSPLANYIIYDHFCPVFHSKSSFLHCYFSTYFLHLQNLLMKHTEKLCSHSLD